MKALELLALLVLQFGTLSTRFTRRHTATCFLRARPISAASISKPCDRLDSAQHCRCESGIHYFDTTSQREEILHLNGEHMSLHTQYTELMPLAGFAHLSCICLASAVESENAEFYAELGHDVFDELADTETSMQQIHGTPKRWHTTDHNPKLPTGGVRESQGRHAFTTQ